MRSAPPRIVTPESLLAYVEANPDSPVAQIFRSIVSKMTGLRPPITPPELVGSRTLIVKQFMKHVVTITDGTNKFFMFNPWAEHYVLLSRSGDTPALSTADLTKDALSGYDSTFAYAFSEDLGSLPGAIEGESMYQFLGAKMDVQFNVAYTAIATILPFEPHKLRGEVEIRHMDTNNISVPPHADAGHRRLDLSQTANWMTLADSHVMVGASPSSQLNLSFHIENQLGDQWARVLDKASIVDNGTYAYSNGGVAANIENAARCGGVGFYVQANPGEAVAIAITITRYVAVVVDLENAPYLIGMTREASTTRFHSHGARNQNVGVAATPHEARQASMCKAQHHTIPGRERLHVQAADRAVDALTKGKAPPEPELREPLSIVDSVAMEKDVASKLVAKQPTYDPTLEMIRGAISATADLAAFVNPEFAVPILAGSKFAVDMSRGVEKWYDSRQ